VKTSIGEKYFWITIWSGLRSPPKSYGHFTEPQNTFVKIS